LAFDEGIREQLLSGGILEILKSFQDAKDEARRAIEGAIWTLRKKEEAEPIPETETKEGHIMISYSWAQKDRMRELGYYLKKLGLKIWLDIEQMEGSILEKMSEAIEEAEVVIIGLSSNYKESQACRTEAEYAYRLKKKVIFVLAEDGFLPKGWLGAMLGNNLWHSPWSNPAGFDSGVEPLLKQLKSYLGGRELDPSRFPSSPGPASPSPVPVLQKQSPSPSPSRGSSMDLARVKVPSNKEPLTSEMMKPERVKEWGIEEVCRWLRMNDLEELVPLFAFHEIKGKSLLGWASMGATEMRTLADIMVFEKADSFILLQMALKKLPCTKVRAGSWNTEEVVSWLKEKGLHGIAEQAKKHGWDGKILPALFHLSSSPSFMTTCNELGVLDHLDQLRFLTALLELFQNGTP